ncbi:MAG TPA: hypothetical protein VHE55_19795 [Fimbriimonadaceae bacterium]|nr:hypothetical protein [Fimbriimonadaceae bacterium]
MQRFALIVFAALGFAPFSRQDPPIRVSYAEVGSRVQIVGRLGEPLGSYLVLNGVRFGDSHGPTMMGGGNFRVQSVNGKHLAEPVELWIDSIKKLPAGRRCKVEGYETGQMIGVPGEVLRRTGQTPPQAVWQFSVEFVTVKTSG